MIYFQLGDIYMSYRQELTPVNNSQLLLKLLILDKFRLVTFLLTPTQRNYNTKLVNTSSGETRVLVTLIHNVS